MAKAPKSEAGRSDAATAGRTVTEPVSPEPQDDRIAELDRRVAELSERIAVASAAAPAPPPADTHLLEQQNARIAALNSLVSNLGEQLTMLQAANARDNHFNATLQRVDAAADAIKRGLASNSPSENASKTAAPGVAPEHDCECGPCECVSCACCTFEIWMSHVRVDQMQLEPGDTNIVPTNVLEVWMFASIDPVRNIGICVPDESPNGNTQLHKQLTDPYGPWVSINRCVGTATVKRGAPLMVPISLTAVEREVTLVEMAIPLNREEWGRNTGYVTLDCCYANYSPIDVPVLMTSWGQAGGAVTGRFIVVKRC